MSALDFSIVLFVEHDVGPLGPSGLWGRIVRSLQDLEKITWELRIPSRNSQYLLSDLESAKKFVVFENLIFF